MKRALLVAVPMIASCGLAAGCGSSSSSSSSSGTKAATGSAVASTTNSSSGGYSRGYGSGSGSGSSSGSSGAGYGSAASSSSGAAAAAATSLSTKHSKFGTILAAGSKQLTVYLFEGDTGSASTCSGACASAWPPVTTKGTPTAAGSATAADLATITRSDGTKQLTYKGHPLYYFVQDKDSSDAYGQGAKAFGASWYVLAPSGVKVDNS